MTNRITEGFDWFPTGKSVAERQRLFAANQMFYYQDGVSTSVFPDVSSTEVPFGFGKSFYYSHSSAVSGEFRQGFVVPFQDTVTPVSEGYFGIRLKIINHENLGADGPILCFYDAVTNAPQFGISFAENGVIRLWRGWPYTGTLLASSRVNSFQEEEWFWIEIYGLVANSGGEVEVRINTVAKISLVGADTQNTATDDVDSVFIGARKDNYEITFAYDDMYFNDTAGTINNSWLGNVRVKTAFMIADGDNIDFSIGGSSPAATNWQSVLNTNLDDTKYVYSGTAGQYDLYDLDPIQASPLVHVVQVRAALRMDDATQRVGRYKIKVNGVEYEGTVDHYMNQTYTMYFDRWELNPNTAAGWTGTEVNGIQPGVKVQA